MQKSMIGKFVIVRTYSAGVHAGILRSHKDREVRLSYSRRLWYWDGAASLSEMAVRGVSKPKKCKFPAILPDIILTEAIEIIPCSKAAQKNIMEVPEWKLHQ